MKTAMQELIEWVKVNDLSLKVSLYNNELINKLDKAIEKESEQIIDAFNYGYYCASDGTSDEFDLKGRRYYENFYQNK